MEDRRDQEWFCKAVLNGTFDPMFARPVEHLDLRVPVKIAALMGFEREASYAECAAVMTRRFEEINAAWEDA